MTEDWLVDAIGDGSEGEVERFRDACDLRGGFLNVTRGAGVGE